MSRNSGRTTKRTLAVENYNGFDVIKVSIKEHEYSSYLHGFTDWGKTTVHYDFCETGNIKKPSMHYCVYAKTVEECKTCIDNFIKDDSLYFTDGERQKYVYGPNKKNGWGFNYQDLVKLMKAHKKSNKRMRILLEDRLTDANFHSFCGLLCEGKYKEFEELAAKECAYREKYEIITNTKRHKLKNPEELANVLKKVLDDYLGAQDTSVDVRFVENW